MDTISSYLIIYFICINLLSFAFMGIDKRKARQRKRRIAEKTFFWLALLGASPGIYLAMFTFRHKTKHVLFRVGIPLLLLLQLLLLYFLFLT